MLSSRIDLNFRHLFSCDTIATVCTVYLELRLKFFHYDYDRFNVGSNSIWS